MYIIASKLNSTFGTIASATADKMTAKVVEKLGPFALALRINLNTTNQKIMADNTISFKECISVDTPSPSAFFFVFFFQLAPFVMHISGCKQMFDYY